MTDDQRLACQRIGASAGEVKHSLGDVFHGSKFAIDSLFQHDCPDHVLLADAQFLGLLGDLTFNQERTDEFRTDHARADVVPCPILGDRFGQAEQAVLCR